MRLQEATGGYRRLHVRSRRLQEATGGYKSEAGGSRNSVVSWHHPAKPGVLLYVKTELME